MADFKEAHAAYNAADRAIHRAEMERGDMGKILVGVAIAKAIQALNMRIDFCSREHARAVQ